MRPCQLLRQCRHNFIFRKFLVKFYHFKGTKEETKRELFRLILEDVQTAFFAVETRDYGTESSEEISEDNETGELYGYSVFKDYHIDYSAKKFSCIKERGQDDEL